MRLLPHARHVEVQLVGDEYGNVVALSGRDCSVQVVTPLFSGNTYTLKHT